MMGVIQELREINIRCQQGEPLAERHLIWLGEALRKFLEHQCVSIDEAMGLKNPRGGVPWWREEQMRRRDHALRALAKSYGRDGSVTRAAREICNRTQRYAASTWRFDRNRDAMPSHYAGTEKELIWAAFKSGAPMPLGERQLRQIIGSDYAD